MKRSTTALTILRLLEGRDPTDPWIDIERICKQTGLANSTVNYNLAKLLQKEQVIRRRENRGKGLCYLYAHVSKKTTDVPPLSMTDTQRKILNMLLKQDPRNPWLDLKQISKQTGRPINTVHYNLRILRKEGQVVGTGGGRGKGRHLFAHVSHNPQPPDVKETIRGSKIRDKIRKVLQEQSPEYPWLGIKQISQLTGRQKSSIQYHLSILLKEGQVVGTGGGRRKGRHLFAHVSHNPQPPVDGKETIQGSKIRNKIRKVLQEQSPEYPWLGIKQISQLTGRQRSTIQYHLSILLKEGQVVEDKLFKPYGYAHVSKVPDASAFKRTKRHEYVPKVSQGQQAEVLVALLMAFTKGYEWVVLDQIGAFDHPKLLDLKVNQLLQLLNRLIEEGMVTCSRHDEHLYYTLTRNGIIEAMKLAKRAR